MGGLLNCTNTICFWESLQQRATYWIKSKINIILTCVSVSTIKSNEVCFKEPVTLQLAYSGTMLSLLNYSYVSLISDTSSHFQFSIFGIQSH